MTFINSFVRIKNFCLSKNGDKFIESDFKKSTNSFFNAAYSELKVEYPKFYKMDTMCQAGVLAVEVLFRDWKNIYEPDQIAVVLSNQNSSIETDKKFAESLKTYPSPSLFVYTLPNIVVGEICIRHGLKGENAFFVSPSFDALLLKNYVNMVLDNPATEVCLAGWVEVDENQQDVFLYLAEKKQEDNSLSHVEGELLKLYNEN